MTLTPVAWVKASSSFTNASSSACTKYFHRNIASCAFFSGFHGAVCAQALAHSRSAGPVSAPAAAAAVAPLARARRVKSVMMLPPFILRSVSLPACGGGNLAVESFAGRPVEQVHEAHIGHEPHAVARLELMALAKDREHILAAELGNELGFRSGRLDHLDFGVDTVVLQGEMLWTHAVDDWCAVGQLRCPSLR